MKQVIKLLESSIQCLMSCNTSAEERIIMGSLTSLIRKWCDEKEIVFVSESAFKESKKLNVNLFEMRWKDQPKFDKGRNIFHLEHKYPVSDMIMDMRSRPRDCENILLEYQVGWILKDEDKRLKKFNRDNHDAIYKDAGIELVFRKDTVL